ncbi:hypothetical protein Hanom_Chr11g01053691 [Helianthus anomalus]
MRASSIGFCDQNASDHHALFKTIETDSYIQVLISNCNLIQRNSTAHINSQISVYKTVIYLRNRRKHIRLWIIPRHRIRRRSKSNILPSLGRRQSLRFRLILRHLPRKKPLLPRRRRLQLRPCIHILIRSRPNRHPTPTSNPTPNISTTHIPPNITILIRSKPSLLKSTIPPITIPTTTTTATATRRRQRRLPTTTAAAAGFNRLLHHRRILPRFTVS